MTICLFDLDGTLVDSREPILRALNTALDDVGLERVTAADLWRHVGPPLQLTLHSLLSQRGDDVGHVPALIEAYRTEYQAVSVALARSYPGVPELLDSLTGRVRLGVVTSKPGVYASPILDALGFSAGMEVVEGPGLTGVEPKPVTLARALTRLGADDRVDDVTVIGDRRYDIEAGRAHNTRTIGVTWGFGSRDELEQAGADRVVDHPGEIADIVAPLANG